MAEVVDGQNKGDPVYRPDGTRFDGVAFKGPATSLQGLDQPKRLTPIHPDGAAREAKAAGLIVGSMVQQISFPGTYRISFPERSNIVPRTIEYRFR